MQLWPKKRLLNKSRCIPPPEMVDFYVNRDATVMMAFMVDCHPDAGLIQMGNKK